MKMSSWYTPDIYGGIQGLNSIVVMGFASSPDSGLVGISLQGASTAVRAMLGKARKGDNIQFSPKNSRYNNIYARTTGRNFDIKFFTHPKTPIVLKNGDIIQMMFRRENPENLAYICYPDDDKSDHRFIESLKAITDFPIHPSWATWLKEKAFELGLWGICDTTPRSRFDKPTLETAGESQYGMQFRWLSNKQQQWEELIANHGLKFGHLKLPED